MNKVRYIFLMCWVFMILLGVAVPQAEAALIGTKEEIKIGQDVANQLEKQYGLVDDPALQERVTRIGMSMVAVSDRRDLPYSFKVLNSKEVNALAAPGGFVYVFKGLVDLLPSDDELAGVIGHEIGHIVKRHTVKQIEKSMGVSILFGVVFGERGALLQNLAYQAIMAGYSRSDERQADELGFYHSFRAGYNPYSMTIGLEKLSTLNQSYQTDLFSDHPEARSRVTAVQVLLDKNGIKPHVVPDGKIARISEGAWKSPAIYTENGGNPPLYRAYFVAGNVYRAIQPADYNAERYILESDGEDIRVYYDDRLIVTITPQEAAAQGVSQADLANTWVDTLRQWPQKP